MAEKNKSWIQTFKDAKTIIASITSMVVGMFIVITWINIQAEEKVKPIAKSVAEDIMNESLKPIKSQVGKLADFTDSTRYDLAELKKMVKDDLKSRGKSNIVKEAEQKSKEDKKEAAIREKYRRN